MEKVISALANVLPFVAVVVIVLAASVGIVIWLIRRLRRRQQEFYEQFADVGGNNG